MHFIPLPGTWPLLFIVVHRERERKSHTHTHRYFLAYGVVCFVQHIALCVEDNAKERKFFIAYFGAPNSFCGINLIKNFTLSLPRTSPICFNNFNEGYTVLRTIRQCSNVDSANERRCQSVKGTASKLFEPFELWLIAMQTAFEIFLLIADSGGGATKTN